MIHTYSFSLPHTVTHTPNIPNSFLNTQHTHTYFNRAHTQLLADEALKSREQRAAEERDFEAECARGVDFLKFVPNVRSIFAPVNFLPLLLLFCFSRCPKRSSTRFLSRFLYSVSVFACLVRPRIDLRRFLIFLALLFIQFLSLVTSCDSFFVQTRHRASHTLVAFV